MSKQGRIKESDMRNICKRVIFFLYTIAMFCVYPIIVDDAYFNITITKTKCFLVATIVFVACYIIATMGDTIINKQLDIEKSSYDLDGKSFYLKPDFWMQLFLLANVVAWYQSYNSKSAFYGDNARYMGLVMYMAIGVMFIAISMGVDVKHISLIIFAVSSFYVYVVGLIQHLELDIELWESGKKFFIDFGFLHYRENLGSKQINIYMSTLGNINIFSSYIVISLSLFIALFIFTEKKYMKIISGVITFLGGASLMIANSDSGYLGVVGVLFVLLLLSYNKCKLRKFILSLVLVGTGNLMVVLLNRFVVDEYDNRGGVAEALDSIGISVGIVLALVAMYYIVYFCDKIWGDKLQSVNKKLVTGVFLILSTIASVLCVIVGNSKGVALFTFDDKWGTYRGFVWSRGWEIFKDAPLVNKLFGYGNESFGDYMNAYFYNDMVEITKKVYDNAHNELLQYLVTIGIFGVVTYLGLCIVSSMFILKYGKNDPIAYSLLAAIIGYFIQSVVNINQPITTPLYFFIMAVGVGYVTNLRKRNQEDDKVTGKDLR